MADTDIAAPEAGATPDTADLTDAERAQALLHHLGKAAHHIGEAVRHAPAVLPAPAPHRLADFVAPGSVNGATAAAMRGSG